jgi:predicted Rossmann fold flavoprotein
MSGHIAVIGGGAAGFFAAIAAAEARPDARVTLLERTGNLLSKVKISGGGRCNVTHACFDPAELIRFYPRGGQALRGPFSRFQPRDTVAWFESRGVALKTEADNRMFPVTDSSQTIIDCLTRSAESAGVRIQPHTAIESLESGFTLRLLTRETIQADRIILATGSNPLGWQWAETLGHSIEPPVPSLFTFIVNDPRLEGLAGVSHTNVEAALCDTAIRQNGPLLITHHGISGPAVLKLSAWGARVFHERGYKAQITLNWLPHLRPAQVEEALRALRNAQARKRAPGDNAFGLPRRLWERLAAAAGIQNTLPWSQISNESLRKFSVELQAGVYTVSGKNTFKEEFVTCGGVRLNEIDFRTMQSKKSPGLYFAGEVIDVDAVTGGFNFQNAWTTGWIAGNSAAATL